MTERKFPQKHGCVIFHHPGPIDVNLSSGSKVRPTRILQAFRDAGYEVETVVGYAAQRKKAVARLLDDLDKGRHFSFVYSESRSIPTLLAEKHRLPIHPFLDRRFLTEMRRAHVPTGLYYRDIFWRFTSYKRRLTLPFRAFTISLYRYDWFWYQTAIDHLFLPSKRMADHLPTPWPENRISALPPGTIGSRNVSKREAESPSGHIQLLYVGGVSPPIYNLSPLFDLVKKNSRCHLTICCREQEWAQTKKYYQAGDRVTVQHLSGQALEKLYQNADIAAILWQGDEYLDFAVPVKVFEAMSFGVPILCLSGSEMARLVQADNTGWVVDSIDEASQLIDSVRRDHDVLASASAASLQACQKHTWKHRVQEIVSTMQQYNKK